MIDEEKQEKHIDKAKEIFGITDNCGRAGYIIYDGEMLDFGGPSEKSDRRESYQHHSEIFQVYEELPTIEVRESRRSSYKYNLIDQ